MKSTITIIINARRKVNNLRKIVLSVMLFVFSLLQAFTSVAQTYLTNNNLSGAQTAGEYYYNSSISLSPGFSFTAATGSSLHLYIVSQTCVPLATTLSNDQNYISTIIPRINGLTTNSQLTGLSTCQAMQSVQYLDGLGRPMQSVQIKGNQDASKDLIQPTAYDDFGRESLKYLPYTDGTAASGSYRADALQTGAGQSAFYGAPPTGVQLISTPYAQTLFDSSPINKVMEQGAPGNDWQISAGHTSKAVYDVNIDNDIQIYRADAVTTSGFEYQRILNNYGYYAAGELHLTISKNENWVSADGKLNTVEEYKDMEGRVILRRTYNTGGQILSTYYVYDYRGILSFVLTPKANPETGSVSQTALDNLCYQYRYDGRKRLIEKRIPGKGWEYMAYYSNDLLAASQDGNLKGNNGWKVFKYDALGRLIETGIWGSGLSRSTVQNNINAGTQFDVRDVSNNMTAYPYGYIISSYPVINLIMTINYYDNYNIPGLPYDYHLTNSSMTNGLPTATLTSAVYNYNDMDDLLWTVNYYDNEGNVTNVYAQHYYQGLGNANVGNYDHISNVYNFNHQITATTRDHYNVTGGSVNPVLSIINTIHYDHLGRKTQTAEQINTHQVTGTNIGTTTGTNVILSQIDYNEIGQIKTKHLHSSDGGNTFMQKIDYTYNERGWLIHSAAPLFDEQLRYNSTTRGAAIQYNGNIAEEEYITPSSTSSKWFTYAYDKVNRLTDGNSSTGTNLTENGIQYDLNGNITQLSRNSSQLIYNYQSQSNQLQSLTGLITSSQLWYDNNGNLVVDYRSDKSIEEDFNILNLPSYIGGSQDMSYFYSVDGSKLETDDNQTGIVTDYIKGIQINITWPGFSITSIQTEEGQAVPDGNGGFKYEYTLKDHLGNNRVAFDIYGGAARPIQETNYFPFGKSVVKSLLGDKNEYLYNNKELVELLNEYDYGARFYDAEIAKWKSVDPLAENTRRWSPYNYGADNPIRNIDPDGMSARSRLSSTPDPDDGQEWADRVEEEFPEEATSQATPTNTNPGSPLSKTDLLAYVSSLYPNLSNGQLENITGKIFEDAWNRAAIASGFGQDNYQKNDTKMNGGPRSTVPDATADGVIQTPFWEPNIVVPKAAWFEVKAKNGNIYNSTDTWQILGHIVNLAASVPREYRDYGAFLHASAASLTFVTTSNVIIAASVINAAAGFNIIVYQYKAYYQMIGGVMYVSFQSSALNGVRTGSTGHTTPPVPLTQ